ncbi:MAG: hypothetical protein OEY56_07330 [Cyclobacteriaceae bacterium]|nr:hypothetical protein [Cyclobacteriaceae bacterium]
MVKRTFYLLICLFPLLAFGQFEPDYEYRHEFLYGINKNTNSGLIGGFVLRYGIEKSENLFQTFGLELINVRHPMEQKYESPQTGASYIWGKQNYLLSVRMQYGLDRVVFRKATQQGVQINTGFAGGLSIGIETPYYVLTSGGDYRPYDPNTYPSPEALHGSQRFYSHLDQAKLMPGVNGKYSLSFEFGTFRDHVMAIEIGLLAELYARKAIIIPTQRNRAFYPSAYFTFFSGKRR